MRTASQIADVQQWQTIFVVQPFEEWSKGKMVGLRPMAPVPARDQNHATLLLERILGRSGVVGAVAYSRIGDPESGEFTDATILGQTGRVPEELA